MMKEHSDLFASQFLAASSVRREPPVEVKYRANLKSQAPPEDRDDAKSVTTSLHTRYVGRIPSKLQPIVSLELLRPGKP